MENTNNQENNQTVPSPIIETASETPATPINQDETHTLNHEDCCSKKSGPATLIVSIIIIVALLAAGLYIWGSRLSKNNAYLEEVLTSESSDGSNTEIINAVEISTQDDVDSLEKELNDTDIESADSIDLDFDAE